MWKWRELPVEVNGHMITSFSDISWVTVSEPSMMISFIRSQGAPWLDMQMKPTD